MDLDIFLLDEPTDALDSLVEKAIFDALPAYPEGKTLCVIAHRLATVQKADCILLLNEMRLVATGTQQEHMKNDDYYHSMVNNQQIFIPI